MAWKDDYSDRPSTSGSDVSQLSRNPSEYSAHDSLLPSPLSIKPQPYQYVSPFASSPPSPVSPLEPLYHAPPRHTGSELSSNYDNRHRYYAPEMPGPSQLLGKIPSTNQHKNSNFSPARPGDGLYRPQSSELRRYVSRRGEIVNGEDKLLFDALIAETKQPMRAPMQRSNGYEEDEWDQTRFLLSSSPSIRRAVDTIRRARDTAVDRPLVTKRKFHTRQGSHLLKGLEKVEKYRPAKGVMERNVLHNMSQRMKRIPKYKDVLDARDRQAILMGARGLWIREWNFYCKLNPPRKYKHTFQDWRRNRQGRHLRSGKIACVFDDDFWRVNAKTATSYLIPSPREETGRAMMKRERKIAKGGIKGAVLTLGRSSAPVPQAPGDGTWSRTSDVSSRPGENGEPRKRRSRARALSIFPGKGKQPAEGGLRNRARSIFVSKESKGKATETGYHPARPAQPPLPSQYPTDARDPCSLNYRRR